MTNYLFLYQFLNLRSKRSIYKVWGKFGRRKDYYPRRDLVSRLSNQLGWSEEKVTKQLLHERRLIEKEAIKSRGRAT